jgi:hypothetical protein
MTFTAEARDRAIHWKSATATLPEPAREPGPYRSGGKTYPFCLPDRFRPYNLLPDARSAGISRFAAAGIPWHKGRAALPCTHLLSSQVQCVNALAPMVRDAAAIQHTFGAELDIAEVLPFGDEAFDPEDLVSFEWVGLASYLNEWTGLAPTRGVNVTSVDAAIRYRTSSGTIEIALIEWKYTEQYHGKKLEGDAAKMTTRLGRYEERFGAGPLRTDLIQYKDLFVEPFYQLMRQQLLAHAIETAGELAADRVRVVYAAPARNAELWTSLLPVHQEVTGADHVLDAWHKMLLADFADRFWWFDTASLLTADASTSEEFRARYQHLAGQ